MKTTVKQIFDYISGMNPTVSTISSMGSFVSSFNGQVADGIRNEVVSSLSEGTLAHKIATTAKTFTEKQLWVIAYELIKNEDFSQKVGEFYARNRKEIAKEEASKRKLADNKANSQSVLDYIKENGRLLKDYYAFVKASKLYKKEFFSKKFTMTSAEAFLAI